jgi:predicted naringenin-chalcone synthase
MFEAIVTVSTTGLAVPSLDAILANRLDLPAAVERLPVFGLGCGGGVSGLARSAQLAHSLPAGNVLLLVVELCTINCRTSDRTIKNFISAALFGDGAAGVLLRRRSGGDSSQPLARVVATGEHMWRQTEDMMGWSIENDGFGVVFSPDTPRCARHELRPALDRFLARHGLVLYDLDGVILHPGGRKVLEAIEGTLIAAASDKSRLGHPCRIRQHVVTDGVVCSRTHAVSWRNWMSLVDCAWTGFHGLVLPLGSLISAREKSAVPELGVAIATLIRYRTEVGRTRLCAP